MNKELVESPYLSQIDSITYKIFIQSVRSKMGLYREQNVMRQSEERLLAKQYRSIIASIQVEIEGENYTLQEIQSGKLLELNDRTKREHVFRKGYAALLKKQENIEQILMNFYG
ncbi:MAG: hypothetical protein AAF806_09680 [Bacteroidota bacterium]